MVVLKPDEELRELESLSLAINIMFCIREKVLLLDINQQNNKPTQEYQRENMDKRPYNSCIHGRKVLYKASNFKNHRIFTLKYIGQNLVPVSIRLKPLKSKQFISANARQIIERAEGQLM